MSFFTSATAYKPPVIRQEGFHLPSSPSPTVDNVNNNNLFYIPDAFRKFNPDGTSMDFGDELASLIAHSPGPPSSHERSTSTHSPDPHQRQQHQYAHDDSYRPHNIFDISAPSHNHNGFPTHFSLPPPSHLASRGDMMHDQHNNNSPFHFNPNTTLPALNSSLRFENPLPTPSSGTDPSSYSSSSTYPQPHTPLGHDFDFAQQTPPPSLPPVSRQRQSRSRSRAPSTGPGPTRTASTTRQKRNSISSTSPPPQPTRPGIVIPRSLSNNTGAPQNNNSLNVGSGWFVPQHSHDSFLPTPDSLGSFNFGSLGVGSLNSPNISSPMNGMGLNSPNAMSGMGGMGMVGSLGISPKDVGHSAGMGVIMKEEPVVEDVAAKQAAITLEKRRRRRESHNAVERRRRDNINEKITELATLIPECMLGVGDAATTGDADVGSKNEAMMGENATPAPASPGAGGDKQGDKDGEGGVKANKGMILRKSVEYIRYLQQLVTAQASRNRDLEAELQAFRSGVGSGSGSEDGSGSVGSMASPGVRNAKAEGEGEEGALVVLDDAGGFGEREKERGRGKGRRYRSSSRFQFETLESVEEVEGDLHIPVDSRANSRGRVGGHVSASEEMMEVGSEEGEGEGEEGAGDDGMEGGMGVERAEEDRGRRGRDGKVHVGHGEQGGGGQGMEE